MAVMQMAGAASHGKADWNQIDWRKVQKSVRRLQVRIDVPAALWGVSVPPLSIATLVENSVKHGVAPATQGGTITVQARDEDGQLVVSVGDTGVGLTQGSGSGTGIGLFNLRARLTTLYGNAGSLRVAAASPRGVDATMRLPCRRYAA